MNIAEDADTWSARDPKHAWHAVNVKRERVTAAKRGTAFERVCQFASV
jgi:hypothetical protein